MIINRRVHIKLQYFVSLLVFMGATALCCSAYAYDYPIDNPYVATIIGTPPQLQAELPKKIPVKTRSLKVIEGREVPEALWYYKKLSYSFVRQKGEAPLVFTISGTGGDHNSGKNLILMRAFYQAGFHVVGLTSPSHPNFVAAASSTGVPGHLQYDAEDLYRVMQQIWADIKGRIEVSEFYLTGYSLGGTQAAFVAKIDREQQVFDFKKVLLVNPSLTLYNSVSKLDRMLENVPGGMDHFNEYFAQLVQKISNVYKRSDIVEFNEEIIYRAFQEERPEDEELAAIIGAAFRISSANMVFTSDLMTNFGFIKPGNEILKKTSPMQDYLRVSMRVGFTDYYHEYIFPYFHERDPSLTRESLVDMLSLRYIEDFLRTAKNIGVVHNQDDIILTKGEIDFFPEVFGDRAKIYPRGGHLGNLDHRDTLAYIVEYFKK
jgi:predicted alpha/beta-fold hydrolase